MTISVVLVVSIALSAAMSTVGTLGDVLTEGCAWLLVLMSEETLEITKGSPRDLVCFISVLCVMGSVAKELKRVARLVLGECGSGVYHTAHSITKT